VPDEFRTRVTYSVDEGVRIDNGRDSTLIVDQRCTPGEILTGVRGFADHRGSLGVYVSETGRLIVEMTAPQPEQGLFSSGAVADAVMFQFLCLLCFLAAIPRATSSSAPRIAPVQPVRGAFCLHVVPRRASKSARAVTAFQRPSRWSSAFQAAFFCRLKTEP